MDRAEVSANAPCSFVRASFIHEKPAGTNARGGRHAAAAEHLEQPHEVEALLVLDALELQERVLREVAREPVEPVVERRGARDAQVERAARLRDAHEFVAHSRSSVTCSST